MALATRALAPVALVGAGLALGGLVVFYIGLRAEKRSDRRRAAATDCASES